MLDKFKRAIKLHPFGTSAKQSEAQACMPKGDNFIAPQALIPQLYYYYFILLLNSIEQFLIQVHICWRDASKAGQKLPKTEFRHFGLWKLTKIDFREVLKKISSLHRSTAPLKKISKEKFYFLFLGKKRP